jgi:hypothetical protein
MIIQGQVTRNTEILTGFFSLLAGLSLIATILTRFEFISFFLSYTEDLEYLTDNLFLLKLNSSSWLLTSLILTISASTFIVLLNPYHRLFSWLTGFFLILASAMICVSAIKGFSIIDLINHFTHLELTGTDSMRITIYSLAKEKELYIMTSYSMLGLAFFSLGGFAYRTRRLSIFTVTVSIITGILLPLFTFVIPESLLSDVGLISGCITFMIVGFRLLFTGLEKKKRHRPEKELKEE